MLPVLYILNKPISKTKKITYSLTKLFGINTYKSIKICRGLGLNPSSRLNNIKKNQINLLFRHLTKKIKIEQKLKFIKKNNLEKLVEIKLVRGVRQKIGLPVRGQRTHTNAKTIKKLNGRQNLYTTKIKGKKKAIMKAKKK